MPSKNNKTTFIFIFFYLLLFCFKGQAQNFQWARQIGNQETDEANAIEVDNNGNSYIIGIAQSHTYDLDPTPNGTQIIDNSFSPYTPYRDIYLIKQNDNGDFVWGKTFGNIKNSQYAYEIKIGTDGNIYIFLQTMDSITNNQLDSFTTIIKMNPDGNELSRIKIKNPPSFFTNTFDIDNQNNFIVSGWFADSLTLDFTNTSVNFQSNNLASYIFKLDNSGNFIWKKIFDYPTLANVMIQTKADGNIIAILNSSDKGIPVSSILNIDTNNTNIIWEKKLPNQGITTFHLDQQEKIIIAGVNGVYKGTIDVDPSSNVVNISSEKFLLWLDSNGNFLDVKEYYVRQYIDELHMLKIESDVQNNIYLVGDYNGKIDADPSSNIFLLENPIGSIQYGNGYLIKFDSNRNFVNALSFNSDYRALVKDLKIKNKNIYLLGDFNSYCDFDPGVGVALFDSHHMGATTTSDGFIIKLNSCDPLKPDGEANQSFCSDKNPTISNLTPNINGIKWYDSAINGNILPATTNIQNGKIYYASQTLNNCEAERLAVTVVVGNTPLPPTGNPNQSFCKSQKATLDNIAVFESNIKWYESNTSTITLANSTFLQDNTTYYASQNVGCESVRTPITVRVYDIPLPNVNNKQTFCILQNATISNIAITTGQNIKWYDAKTAGNILPITTILQNGTTYYASQTISGCESERVSVVINIQNTPPPTGTVNQPFCSGQNPTIANIQVNGDLIKWYDAISNGNLLPTTTNLQNGKTYYVSQTLNNCESKRLGITVTIGNTPLAPTGNPNQSFCKSQKATLDNIAVFESNIKWYESNTSTITLANSTLLQDNTTYYASQNIGCESPRTPISIKVYDTPLPNGNNKQTFCIYKNATINDIDITGTLTTWYDAKTAGNILPITTILQNGTYYATQTLNGCESERYAVTIKIQDTQAPFGDATQTFCEQQNATLNTIKITGENIKWYDRATLETDLSESTPLENGNTYYASQTINGCESNRTSITIQILKPTTPECINYMTEFPFPKFFTPNNDGYNDTWTIDFDYLAPNTGIKIFDRYGKFIKELHKNNVWDGTYIGREEPASDYWFTITRLDGTSFRGHFTLKR